MGERKWIPKDEKLCLSGYPIWIERTNDPSKTPFLMMQEGRRPFGYSTLACAKMDAERRADELDEFVS